MDFKKLEGFLAIASTGKFTEASERLFMSQSSLSKQMKSLEQELGVSLFKKTRGGTELTQAGWDFYAYARKTIAQYRRTVEHLKIYREDSKLPLRVGSLPLVEDYGLDDVFSSYWTKHPSVQIEYFERDQETLIDRVLRHTVDLALARLDVLDPAKFEMRPLVQDELVVACADRNPLSTRRSVELRDLRNEQFIMLEEKSDITRRFCRLCEEAGFVPSIPLHHSRHRMLLKAVQHDMGISVVPRKLASAMHAPSIAIVPFTEPIKTDIGFIWQAGEGLSDTAMEFIDFVCHDAVSPVQRAALPLTDM